jgi:hypothetical protein
MRRFTFQTSVMVKAMQALGVTFYDFECPEARTEMDGVSRASADGSKI